MSFAKTKSSDNVSEPYSWEITSYHGKLGTFTPQWPLTSLIPTNLKAYKVVNDAVGQVPFASDSLMRQVTVRITSTQQYRLRGTKDVQEKQLTEYFVIQKLMWFGEDEPWKVWGTVEPTTEKEIQKILDDGKAEGSLMDRVKAWMPANFGGGNVPM